MDWHNPRHWQNHMHLEWRHARRFRRCLLAFFFLLLLLGIVPYFISHDWLKRDLAESLRASTGRTLQIAGGARIVVLPRPALLLEEVTLSEPDGKSAFARAKSLSAELGLWDLLQGKPVLRELEIVSPSLNVLRREDGRYNFDDLLRQRGGRLKVALDQVDFSDASFVLSDEFLGQSVHGRDVELSLSNLSDPKNGQLKLGGQLQLMAGKELNWQGELSGRAAVRYFEQEQRVRVVDLLLEITQNAPGNPALQLKDINVAAHGALDFAWNPLRFAGGSLKLSVRGQRASQQWTGEIDVPEIRFAEGILAMHRMQLQLDMHSPGGRFAATLHLPTLAGTGKGLLRTDSARIKVSSSSPQQQLNVEFVSPLELESGARIRLPQYQLSGSYSNRDLPRGAIRLALNGRGELDVRNESLLFDNQGQLDGAPMKARVQVLDFVKPKYDFDLDLDKLDLTPYLPVVADGARAVDPEKPFDLWWLDALEARGQVRIGELVLQRLHVNELQFRLSVAERKVVLDPLSAQLYDGTLNGRFEMNAGIEGREPHFRVQQRLSNMNINRLLYDVLGSERFEGMGYVNLDVAAVGDRISDLRSTAGGSAQLSLSKGAIRGIDLPAVLRVISQQIQLLKGESVRMADLNARTQFSELKASLRLKHGVASNQDLRISAGVLALTGNGDLNLASGEVDYLLEASGNPKVPELAGLSGLVVPVHIRGKINQPEYVVDYTALREQVEARQAVKQ